MSETGLARMPLLAHLRELRTRLIYSVGAVVAGLLLSSVFASRAMEGLTALCRRCDFIVTRPTESFTSYFRTALVLGLVVATPVVIYQAAAFVLPALHRNERRYLYLMVPGAAALFALGMAFAYWIVLPRSIDFLAGFLFGLARPAWSLGNYIAFVTNLMFVIGLAFQTPVVVFVLTKVGLLSVDRMKRYRRHAVLVIAVAAAVLTPTPDPFTMFFVMLPMMVLYELGILLARFA